MYQTCRPLGLIWTDVLRENLFQIGFLLKAILIFLLLPIEQIEWFVPFMVNWLNSPLSLPWTDFLSFPTLEGNDALLKLFVITQSSLNISLATSIGSSIVVILKSQVRHFLRRFIVGNP